jgi:hypothetical protein
VQLPSLRPRNFRKLSNGLLKGSFIPSRPIGELRDVTRRRTHLQSDRNRVLNRIRRLLETANFKLGPWSVILVAGLRT